MLAGRVVKMVSRDGIERISRGFLRIDNFEMISSVIECCTYGVM